MRAHLNVSVGAMLLLGAAACDPEQASTEPASAPESEPTQAEPVQAEVEIPTMMDLDEGPDHHVTFRPDEVDWQPGPGSFEEGSEFAVLEGDPSQDGVFTMQIKMPDGFVINPHWHPNVERVTVLAGTFLLGSGEVVDEEAAEELPTGTYASMPPEMVHHAIADGETIIQLTSVGPWEINYVNPDDDPRD